MNRETQKFLSACKKAGYEHIAIGVADKRVPSSMLIEKAGEQHYSKHRSSGAYWGDNGIDQPKVVCGEPQKRESGWPAIWKICEESSLTAGLHFRGCGCGETHEIRATHNLECGYYNLARIGN